MLVYIVQIHVKPEYVQEFISATIDNAANSIKEPGIIRFDFIQQNDDPTRFTLIEIYKSEDAPAKHKETAHYLRWRDRVTEMMMEPRKGLSYRNLYPMDEEWS